ncbi:lantibiotic dehydratase C-terminal domain-containing protein [Archangium violaceum]|uniref:lantibiotic dehydratase C-terminal domain-containing protein n=1 Tax=Archangium violaceum TaxID=83451 RepID=UPI002B30BE55|nr:lantibiotic dehydratase C-terminal domain-containing protein [Archangium gephyra]
MNPPPSTPAPAPSEELPSQEPLLSASIYCDGLLDELLQRAVAPFWHQVRQDAPPRRYALWMLRYSRRGSHLKVRIHGPPSASGADRLRQQLRHHVEPFLAGLGPRDPSRARLSSPDTGPMDPEDEGDELHPDRTLLWTNYRLIPGHLGREPLSAAPDFANGYVRCLSAAADLVLEHLVLEPGGGVRPATRIGFFLRWMLVALEALELSPEEELEYLLFHRDWLLLGSKGDWQNAVSFLERKARNAGPQLQQLEAAATRRHAGPRESQAPELPTRWREALRQHFRHALSELGASDYQALGREPRHQLLAAIARVLHNTANLLEVDLSNEIYVCHLLGRALLPLLGPTPPVSSFLVNPTQVSQ